MDEPEFAQIRQMLTGPGETSVLRDLCRGDSRDPSNMGGIVAAQEGNLNAHRFAEECTLKNRAIKGVDVLELESNRGCALATKEHPSDGTLSVDPAASTRKLQREEHRLTKKRTCVFTLRFDEDTIMAHVERVLSKETKVALDNSVTGGLNTAAKGAALRGKGNKRRDGSRHAHILQVLQGSTNLSKLFRSQVAPLDTRHLPSKTKMKGQTRGSEASYALVC